MNCSICGALADNNAKFCPVCGASLLSAQQQNSELPKAETLYDNYEETGRLDANNPPAAHENVLGGVRTAEQQPFVQNFQQNYTVPNFSVLDEKSFYKQFASKNTKGWTTTLIVGCFLTVVSSILPLMSGNIFSILDIVFYLAFGILLIVQKKWYFALPVTIYSGIWTIVTVLMAGAATGILALIAGIASTIKLKKLNEAYKQYKTSGLFPSNMI